MYIQGRHSLDPILFSSVIQRDVNAHWLKVTPVIMITLVIQVEQLVRCARMRNDGNHVQRNDLSPSYSTYLACC